MFSSHSLLKLLVSHLLVCSDALGWSLADRLAGRVPLRRIQTIRRATADQQGGKSMSSSSSSSSSSSTKQHQQAMIDFMDQPMETTVGDAEKLSSPISSSSSSSSAQQKAEQEQLEFVKCIVKAADGRKADDIVALRVDKVSTLTSVLVILSGNSRPQNQAIAAAIQKDVEEMYGLRPGGSGVPEGSAESGWMLLDYGNVMVHIMTPKSRLYYNVEGQWRDKGGEYIDISDVLVPNRMEQTSKEVDFGENGYVKEEDDPFWS